MPEPAERTALYRLYDVNDRLLYVGITANPKARWSAHSRDKHWWPEVARKAIEWFETRKSAERIEKIEVEEERPRYNKVFNGSERRMELHNEGVARAAAEARALAALEPDTGERFPPFWGAND
ncbi:GIY-YIG nuclease family protein [Streptomyces sp. ASQP_92]|uniref:GIY-YIG nuclease family protein n=1 Tax=Streptomyces sp. ASQP_92 TaxID=2979116 RepID=UPI0021BEB9B0|nr:GIY-YIG nuclease family protein [Streptomyces sp. ASQP_92]MCT9092888.1 GIY-YIG nuclease family protein [Streptomyces sp. ASQP_92]